jgi:hypothetical protein
MSKAMGMKAHTVWSSLLTVRLHSNMSVQVVQSTVSFLATVPAALVHALNIYVSPPRSLVLRARIGVNWRQRMSTLGAS